MGFQENIVVCQKCPHRFRPCGGPCPCLADGKGEDIIHKATTGECPKMLFPSRGLGDTIAKITTAVGIKPCGGCKKRQAEWNEKVPYASPVVPPGPDATEGVPGEPQGKQDAPGGRDEVIAHLHAGQQDEDGQDGQDGR